MRWLGSGALFALGLLGILLAGCSSPVPAVATPVDQGVGFAAQVMSESITQGSAAATPVATATAATTAAATAVPLALPTPPATATVIAAPIELEPEHRPIAVVVENDPASRPPTNLGAADVIYEAIAEFDLTRLVAVFADASADSVGPIRSARDYHVAIAAEYEAALAHCLGVPTMAQIIKQTAVTDLDGCRVTNPPGFYRDWGRRMPHNLYVKVPDLVDWAGGTGTYGPFQRRQEWPRPAAVVDEIAFVYPAGHPVRWRFDEGTGQYRRWQDGAEHRDANGEQIAASTVVVQAVPVKATSYFGERGYHALTLTGQGKAVIYANGGKLEVTWRRDELSEPTRFLNAEDAEIVLPPGRVFVQLVDEKTAVAENTQLLLAKLLTS